MTIDFSTPPGAMEQNYWSYFVSARDNFELPNKKKWTLHFFRTCDERGDLATRALLEILFS
jgi:hypothetical protein